MNPSSPLAEPPNLALYTCAAFPNLYPDDLRLPSALAQVGLRGVPQRWDQPLSEPCAAGLLRSPWDYYLRPDAFLAFLHAHEQAARPLLNPVPLVRWNFDKHYLLSLAAQGVAIVPTKILPAIDDAMLPDLWREFGELVIKPTVSAGSWRTLRLPVGTRLPTEPPGRTRGATFDSPSPEPSAYLVQPFLPQIAEGEWSLIFFDGEFSHAVRKRPKPGEFRVQEHYGGSPEATPPSESLLRQAHAVLAALPRIPEAACPTPPCYARIDGVCDGDRFLLMELELIEPALFFAYTQGGEERLAHAVRRSLQRAGLA